MNRPRAPPKKRVTPADDKSVLATWKTLHKQYTSQGLTKSESYQKIGEQFGTSRVTVYRWLNENARHEHYESNKNQPRLDRDTPEYRLRTKTRFHLYRHLDDYLTQIFENTEHPLTADQITLKIRDHLEAEGKPAILMKNSTLEKLAASYDPPLLERVEGSVPSTYKILRQ
jgi:hypothetical protein